MKILITGGHPAPALAVIEELRKLKQHDIVFVGKQYTEEGKPGESYEYKHITKLRIPFYNLRTGRLTRIISINTAKDFINIGRGFMESLKILEKEEPDVVMSFGGYIALPICFAARLKRIKILTHEQTISPGVANKHIGKIADKILVSFPETIKYFDVSKTRVTGNPIREAAKKTIHKPFDFEQTKPILYITGGSLGSHSINIHIENILDSLLKQFVVIHQVGNVERYGDLERLSRIKRKNYFVRDHITSKEIGWVLRNADIVVSRAGANTTFELIYYRKPCVLIPLPWSANGEQERHAQLIANAGAGEMFDQYQKSSDLLDAILRVQKDYPRYKKAYKKLQKYIHPDAAKLIVQEILE